MWAGLLTFSAFCYLASSCYVNSTPPVGTWDFSKSRSEDVVGWPSYQQNYILLDRIFGTLRLVLPDGNSATYSNVWALASKNASGSRIDAVALMFGPESLPVATAHAQQLLKQWNLDTAGTEASLADWKTMMTGKLPDHVMDPNWQQPFSDRQRSYITVEIKYGSGLPTPWHLYVTFDFEKFDLGKESAP